MVEHQPTLELERKLEEKIGSHRFQLWFKKSARLQVENNEIRVSVPNQFVAGWIDKHFSGHIREIVGDSVSGEPKISFVVDPKMMVSAAESSAGSFRKESASSLRDSESRPKIRRKLRNSLDSFVVGSSNRMAYTAIMSVAEHISSPYNPLFIYGGCGLGKTHLLQGLCNTLVEKHPKVGWQYISGEEFTNQFVLAVKNGSIDSFRRQYRNVDVLVIDDVHFLANKRATQEEFLHTFNAINAAGKQVVMASDSHPKGIGQFNNSLIDRFISGMVVQIDKPDKETRSTIIHARAKVLGHDLSDSVVDVIAEKIRGNVRELEGAILKLFAYSSLCNKPVNLEIAEKVIREFSHLDRGELRISEIEAVVAEYFGVTPADVRCSKRTRTVSLARAVAMYLARKHTPMSFPEIGKYLGNKNHSTVLLACKKIDQQLSINLEVCWDAAGVVKTVQLVNLISDVEGRFKN
jgi:chromosomal replication initiator protein